MTSAHQPWHASAWFARWLVLARRGAAIWCVALLSWSVEATQWFVDNTATGSASGLSWANAFTHLSQLFAANVLPDDTVFISGGPSGSSQTYGGFLRIANNGTSGHPITITTGTDSAHNGTVILDGGDGSETFSYVEMTGRQYVVLDGSAGDNAIHWGLNNLFNTSDRTMANKVFADNSVGLVVRWCGFTNVNNGVRLQSAQSYNVSHCAFKNIRGDAAIRAVGCGPDAFDSNVMEYNDIHLAFCTNCPALVYGPDGVQGSYGMTFRYSSVTCEPVNFYTSTQHPDFLQWTGNHNKAYANWFLNPGDSCIDLDCFANAAPSDWWIYNNILQIATNCGAILGAISPNPWFFRTYSSGGPTTSYARMKIVNNLFLDNSGWNSIAWAWNGTPTLSGITIANNTFMNSSPLFVQGSNPNYSPAAFGLATNIYATGGSWLVQGSSYSTNTWGSQEPSAIFAVPSLVSYSPSCLTTDPHLATGDTVATGKGANFSAMFTIDKDQVTRSVPWDVGPYKASGTPFLPPNTPSNVLPVNLATNQSLTPALFGTPYSDPQGSGQTHAEFQIYDSTGTNLLRDSGVLFGAITNFTFAPPAALSPATSYRWQCRYQNASLWSIYSAQTTFTTAGATSQPPTTPTNITPANGSTGNLLNPTLQASNYADPQGSPQLDAEFIVYFADGFTIAADSGTNTLGAVTAWTVNPVLQSGQTYRWSARYRNSLGLWSATSAQTQFITAPTNASRVAIRAIVTKANQIIFP